MLVGGIYKFREWFCILNQMKKIDYGYNFVQELKSEKK